MREKNKSTEEYSIEIKGNFPVIRSIVPLQLLDGEQLILQQYGVSIIEERATLGILSLTNKRILVEEDDYNKALRANPLLFNENIAYSGPVPEIKLSYIMSVQAVKSGKDSGAQVITKDGFAHTYLFRNLKLIGGKKETINARDRFISLIQSAIK